VTDLQVVAFLLAAAFAAAGVAAAGAPARVREWARRFPRDKWCGRVLTTVDLVWVAWLLFRAPLGRFESLKPALYLLTPVAIVLVACFLDELLAPRALGGALLLAPDPMLQAAQWHESSLRFLVSGPAYVLVVLGMALLLSPHLFRKAAGLLKTDGAWRAAGAVCILLALGWLVLGVAAY